jgi:ribonuclease HI
VWKLLGLGDIIKKACAGNRAGEVILQNLLCTVEKEIHVLGMPKLREIVATTTWYLWYERRKLTHGEPTQGADQINLAVRSMAANFIISCSPKAKRRVTAWVKPRHGYMKLNVDAGYDVDTLEGTVGAVLRDHTGKFIAAANGKIDICFDSFTAEATAVRFGMNLARTVGVTKIEINSDSVEVIEALKDGYSSSVASAIFDDCFFMSLDFNHVTYEHCVRECNQVAHELARIAKFSPPDLWMDSAPGAIIQMLVNDASILTLE